MAVARKAKTASEASKNTSAATITGGERGAQPTQQDAVALIKADHRQVEQLFKRFESAGNDEQKQQIVQEVCTALIVHAQLEEEIFYPACRQKADDSEPLDEAQVEHDGAKVLIADLMSQRPGSPYFEAKVTVLQEYISHHVAEEEKPNDGILAKAASAGVDMQALGARLAQRKQELMSQASSGQLPPPQPRSFDLDSRGNRNHRQEGQDMERRFDRDRDERGRFTSDDDDYGRGGRGSSRGRDDFGGGRYANERERDDRGRFMSDDDGRSGSRSGGGGGDGRGWRGDSQGHSEASRRGWDEREGGNRSRGRDDDDDRRYSSRSSGGGNEGRGWYGDSQGHSEASRRGWEEREGGGRSSSRGRDDDDDRRYSSRGGGSSGGEGRGWYGDPQGHSEASRRGWEEREGGGRSSSRGRDDDDDRRYSSRGGSDDDDRRGSGRDQGGWFGDSRGHAEAARKGWRNRD